MQRKVWTGDEPEMRFPKSAIFWKKITPKRVFGVGLPYRSLQVKGFASSPDHSAKGAASINWDAVGMG